MQHTIMLADSVRCTDGRAGAIDGLIINPNRNHVDYVVVRTSESGGREYFVPSGQIQRISARELSLPCTWTDLESLPHPDRPSEQGTVVDNLPDLIVAREQTIVRDAAGNRLGDLHGVIVDSDLEVHALLLSDAPDRAVPIAQIMPHADSRADMVVQLAHEAMVNETAPNLP
jgi:hypothetical protein